MSRFPPGSFVQHNKMKEWGIGVLGEEEDGNVTITFPSSSLTKRFKPDQLRRFFSPVPDHEVPDDVKAPPTRAKGKGKARATITKCTHCGGPLNKSRYSTDGKLKSCPNCSQAQGKAHVYHSYPAAFGTTEARENTDNAAGVQSYCNECRGGEAPTLTGVTLCSGVVSQSKQP